MNLSNISSQIAGQVFKMLLPWIILGIIIMAVWSYMFGWWNRAQGVTQGVVSANVYANDKVKQQQRILDQETRKQDRTREEIEKQFIPDHKSLDLEYKGQAK